MIKNALAPLAVSFVVIGALLSYASSWNDSLIIDEIPHVTSGYAYLVKGDMRIGFEHPPLVKDLAAIPWLFLNLNEDAFNSPRWMINVNDQFKFGRQMLYQSGNDADLMGRLAHIPMLLFFVLSAFLIWKWTKKLYGDRTAFLAVFLFSFSPTLLAHAHFVTTDVAAIFGIISATYFFIEYLQKPSKRNFWIASLIFGVAMLCKFSTILLVPLFIVIALVWNYKTLWKTTLIMFVGFTVVVWPIYYLHVRNYPPDRQRSDTLAQLETSNHFAYAKPIIWLSDKPVLRAIGHYGAGLFRVSGRWKGGSNVYFFGTVKQGSRLSYFPFVYLVKEPLTWWILTIIALGAIIAKIKNAKIKMQNMRALARDHIDIVAMVFWLLLYWAASLKGGLNIGIRHLLPIYPFMIILVSGQINRLMENKKWRVLVYFLCLWYVVETARIFPHYLSYFNQFVGGTSQAHRYVVDSNLDWGQDIKRFGAWVEKNNIPKIEFDYFGWADPPYYLGDRFVNLAAKKYQDEADFRAHNTSDGWIAVSVTSLMNKSATNYAWLYFRQPMAVIGTSIFVYKF